VFNGLGVYRQPFDGYLLHDGSAFDVLHCAPLLDRLANNSSKPHRNEEEDAAARTATTVRAIYL